MHNAVTAIPESNCLLSSISKMWGRELGTNGGEGGGEGCNLDYQWGQINIYGTFSDRMLLP